MLPDLSPAHILIVIVVALIVVGPKDLPALLRKIGQFMGRMRGMANEFRASFDEMARQSELDELRKEIAAMRAASESAVPSNLGIDEALLQGDTLSDWQSSVESGAHPIGTPAEEASILPPTSVEATASDAKPASKPRAQSGKGAKSDKRSDGAAPKPRAKAAAKAVKVASETDTAAAPKPRAKKVKPGADA
jgi:sec-independent protein translocase protein TatB